MSIDVNIWAILVSSVVNMVVGALWYSPPLFGKHWMRLTGIAREGLSQGNRVVLYVGSYFAGLILAGILAVVISATGVETVWEALILAAMVWLGFTAAPSYANAVFEGKPLQLWAINSAHPLVSVLLMSVILIEWQ